MVEVTSRSRPQRIWPLLLLLSGAFGDLRAQPIWPASDIRNLGPGAREERLGLDAATTLVQIQEPDSGWIPVWKDSVYTFDRRLKVELPISLLVRLDYERQGQCPYRGNLTFLADPRHPDDVQVTRGFFDEPSDSALFFLDDVNGIPSIDIEDGSLVVFWEEGSCPLDVYWAGHHVPIRGTEVLFQTYRGGDSTMVYVRSGEVDIQAPALNAPIPAVDGDFVLLLSDGTARRILLGAVGAGAQTVQAEQTAELWEDATRYHGDRVWRGWLSRQWAGFRELPWPVQAVAGVGIGAGAVWGGVALYDAVFGSEERRVRITVTLPP